MYSRSSCCWRAQAGSSPGTAPQVCPSFSIVFASRDFSCMQDFPRDGVDHLHHFPRLAVLVDRERW